MNKLKRCAFDVPVEGVSERYMSMDELLRAFRSCKGSDPETAQSLAEYACDCGSIQAKLEYSIFLRTSPKLSMPQLQRYRKAERLLLELMNILDMPDPFTAKVALELGALYADCLHRPVGALSMYLYAKRLGATVEDAKLTQLQKKLENTDINLLRSSCTDALRLGRELYYADGAPRLTELFLREAADKSFEEMSVGKKGAESLYGQACLALGDLYDARLLNCSANERTAYRAERDRMYSKASAYGHCEILRHNNPA